MSQKRHKKRAPQRRYSTAATPAAESEFASDGRRKRMNRTARNILLFTLVLLAAVQLGLQMEVMGEMTANLLSLVGLVLLIAALWIQFRNPNGGGQAGVRSPRLK